MYQTIRYEKNGNIGIATINRPEALNALNSTVISELEQLISEVDSLATASTASSAPARDSPTGHRATRTAVLPPRERAEVPSKAEGKPPAIPERNALTDGTPQKRRTLPALPSARRAGPSPSPR